MRLPVRYSPPSTPKAPQEVLKPKFSTIDRSAFAYKKVRSYKFSPSLIYCRQPIRYPLEVT